MPLLVLDTLHKSLARAIKRSTITSSCRRRSPFYLTTPPLRAASTGAAANKAAGSKKWTDKIQRVRNVSFWGHIDAGKTTLTEKVLYLANALAPPEPQNAVKRAAGQTARMLPGDVDSGSTVTDFLEAERQRGITIQSAAVGPFTWSTTRGAEEEVQSGDVMLIDTPGHIDFTIEVERSLRVADGCVVLIDGVEGVESQTEGVWRIAQRYNVRSHVVFVNKLDRMGSSLSRSIRSIVTAGLHARPVLLQLPIFQRQSGASSMDEETLVGLVDLTSSPLVAHFYGGKAGEEVSEVPLEVALAQGKVSEQFVQSAIVAREQIVENIANLDEDLLEKMLKAMEEQSGTNNYTDAIRTTDVRRAVRRLVVRGEILPVLCGSAAKGIGVQDVLNAIVDYLPSPIEAGDFQAAQSRGQTSGCVWAHVRKTSGGRRERKQAKQQQRKGAASLPEKAEQQDDAQVSISLNDATLSLLAFKVIWDKRKGPMTFVRVYSGSLSRSSTLLNTKTGARERLSKILYVYADRHVETETLEAGQIGVLVGLRDTRTGDTLVEARPQTTTKGREDDEWKMHASSLTLRRVNVPPPVFSMSMEPRTKSDEGPLREALDMLIRTDPSLHLDQGGEGSAEGASVGLGAVAASTGGQMVLSGMGELHMEIARDRLINEFDAKARLGDVRVNYRETTVDEDGKNRPTVLRGQMLDRELMGQRLKAACDITLSNLTEEDGAGDAQFGGNVITIEDVQKRDLLDDNGQEGEAEGMTDDLDAEVCRRALQTGLVASLSRGPLGGNPLTGLRIHIDNVQSYGGSQSPAKAFSLLAAQALKEAVKVRGAVLMEPFMNVRIQSDGASLGKIVGNLTSEQNGIVERVEHGGEETNEAHEGERQRQLAAVYIPPSDGVDGGGMRQTEADEAKTAKCSIYAVVPLVQLVRYSSTLRALSRGSATYEMSFQGFAVVTPDRQRAILTDLGRL